MQIADADIGGARVRRMFSMRGEQVQMNRHLSADEVLAIPIANRRALIDGGFLEVYPKRSPAKHMNEARFVIRVSKEKEEFDVITGYKLNDKPLSRVEADRLAGRNSATKG
jgi:hypothetical protein